MPSITPYAPLDNPTTYFPIKNELLSSDLSTIIFVKNIGLKYDRLKTDYAPYKSLF